jgi:proteasome accessory factor B
VDLDPDAPVSIAAPAGQPGLRGSEGALGKLLAAIDSGRVVQFSHRPSRTEPYVTRTVEPWGVLTERGRWYLVGHDRDRDATRVFRLSRIDEDVTPIGPADAVRRPEGVDLRQLVAGAVTEVAAGPAGTTATVWLADGRATALRQAGTSVGPQELAGREGEVFELAGATDWLVREIAGYGADAVVLEPSALRDDVIARLSAHAEASDEERRP